jgi:hypothetical protein
MTISRVSICNSALLKLGAERITALDGSSKEARICEEQYEKMRDLVLQDHPWNFALVRVELASTSNTPVFEWDYEFQLPVDCLRVIRMQERDYEFVVEGKKLLTNYDTCKILYISKVEYEANFTAYFAEALAMRLASDLAYNLIQNPGLAGQFLNEYKQFIRDARSIDAQEGTPENVEDNSYILSRT